MCNSVCLTLWASQVAQVVKNPPVDAEDVGLIPGSGRSPGEGNGNPLQYSCLENSMDRGAWQATVCGVAKSWTRLNESLPSVCMNIRGVPRWCGGKESTHQCRRRKWCGFHTWFGKIPWRRKWSPTPVCLPGKLHGQSSLVGYSP